MFNKLLGTNGILKHVVLVVRDDSIRLDTLNPRASELSLKFDFR